MSRKRRDAVSLSSHSSSDSEEEIHQSNEEPETASLSGEDEVENIVVEEEEKEKEEEERDEHMDVIEEETTTRKKRKKRKTPTKRKQSTKKTTGGEDDVVEGRGGGDMAVEETKKNTKKPAKVKRILEKTDVLHCIAVITALGPTGLDIGCLIMVNKSGAAMRMYCVRLDETTRHMLSPFYEHKLLLRAEKDDSISPSFRFLSDFTGGGCFYNVCKWSGTTCRIGHDPQQLRYIPATHTKIATILKETFFFLSLTNHGNKRDDTNNMDTQGGDDGDNNDDDDEDETNNGTDATTVEKNHERACIIKMLLPDPQMRRRTVAESNNILQNDPLFIIWQDSGEPTRNLRYWLREFKRITEVNKEDKKPIRVHNLYWCILDSDPVKSSEIVDKFYASLRPTSATYADSGGALLTTVHIRNFIDTWSPFFPIRVFLCNNLDTMPDLHYIYFHLHTYIPDRQITMPYQTYTHNEMNDVAKFMQYVERLFVHNLPVTTVSSTAATSVVPLISATETTYHDYKKLMVNIRHHIQQIVRAYEAKYAVIDSTMHRKIKLALLRQIVVPYMINEIDTKARSENTYNRSTCYAVSLHHIMSHYAELMGIDMVSNVHVQKCIRLVVSSMNGSERDDDDDEDDHEYDDAGDYIKLRRSGDADEHCYTLQFMLEDICQMLPLLSTLVISRTVQNNPWRQVTESIRRINVNTADQLTLQNTKRIILFRISTADTQTGLYEEENHNMINELFLLGEEYIQVSDDISSLIVPRVTYTGTTPSRFNVALCTAVDILTWKDAKLIQHVVRERPANTMVVVPTNSCYPRGMLPRHFTMQKMPRFYTQYCVSVDQLSLLESGVANKKTYIVVPYLHLFSPKEMNQLLVWLSTRMTAIKRIFITGSIDMMAATPGQVFVDLLRQIDYAKYNQLMWQFDRPVAAFDTVMTSHWRLLEFSERTPENVTRFMQTFHRMTTTVCHGMKDLWYVKDYPTMAFFIATIMNKLNQRAGPLNGVPNIVRRNNAATAAMPDYTYTPFKNLRINVHNRYGRNNKSIGILKDSLRHEVKHCAMDEIIISYSEHTTALDTLQLDRFMTGYSLGYDEIKHINRHIYVIAMADVLKLTRNELHILFCMANNVFIVDSPMTPFNNSNNNNNNNNNNSNYPLKVSSSAISQQWQCCPPTEVKERITNYFASLSKYTSCRYTHESYLHDVSTPPSLSYNNNHMTMDDGEEEEEEETTTKRKRTNMEDEDEVPKKKNKTKMRQSLI